MAHRLLRLNLHVGQWARASSIMMICNLAVSAVLILKYNSEGLRSVTTLITNGGLLLPRHIRAAAVCLAAATNHGRGGEGTSLYKRVMVNFNSLSINYLESAQYAAVRDSVTWADVEGEEAELEQRSLSFKAGEAAPEEEAGLRQRRGCFGGAPEERKRYEVDMEERGLAEEEDDFEAPPPPTRQPRKPRKAPLDAYAPGAAGSQQPSRAVSGVSVPLSESRGRPRGASQERAVRPQ